MDYTQSNSFDMDAATGGRLHNQSKAVPTAVSDSDLNGLTWEMLSIIKGAGLTPQPFDKAVPSSYTQALSAIATMQRQQTNTAFTTTGTTGAFVLTPSPAIAAYAANQRFRVKFHAMGNGSDTMNVSGLGTKSIKQYDSTGAKVAPVLAANQLVDVEYDGADFVLIDPLPASLAAMGFANSKTGNGYQKLPGGLIIQWGAASYNSAVAGGSIASIAFSFPISFPAACLRVVPGLSDASYGLGGTAYASNRSLNGGVMNFWNAPGNGVWGYAVAEYIAIGY